MTAGEEELRKEDTDERKNGKARIYECQKSVRRGVSKEKKKLRKKNRDDKMKYPRRQQMEEKYAGQ